MKKYGLFLIGVLFFVGCSNKIIDPCVAKEKICLTKCKVEYPDEGIKYKACTAKCYTIYAGCKAKEKVSEGYEKTKEFIKEKTK